MAQRKLAAIMFTDIVGYTAMMQKDETNTLAKIERYKRVHKEQIKHFEGDILKFYGDGSLTIFDSVYNAVECALKIQQVLQKKPKVPVRIGIHTGEIIFSEDDVYGDGINVTSRIQSLGIPGSVLFSKDVYEKIRNHSEFEFICLGDFVLKNVLEPINIYAIKHTGIIVPTPKDILKQFKTEKTAQEVKKHNLRISTTSFIGREKEKKEVKDLIVSNRLVTLIGAGGCGKTRLAEEIAISNKEDYEDGVWFIDLATVSDPILVSKSIIQALNIKEQPDKAINETLIDTIKDKSLLIILDNCEHLIQECALMAENLLHNVEGIRIIATSREALNIPGEVVWRIPSLSFPDNGSNNIDEIKSYEAIKLFTDRAKLNKPGFNINTENISYVIEICKRVDGIPLAIELAATRIRHLGPDTILERLQHQFKILDSSSRTAPKRQQTLKATIDWSYNLLSEDEQLLFSRLSVFTNDFSLEAFETICSDDKLSKENILPLLSQLVDKSLLLTESQDDGSIRYRCLEPLRQYGLQKLTESKEKRKFRHRHLSYYLKMAEEAYKNQFESFAEWTHKLEMEHDNLLSAISWADDNSPDEYRELTGTLAWFWRSHGDFIIGGEYLKNALAKKKDRGQATARILTGIALMTTIRTGYKDGIELCTESLEIWHELGDLGEQAILLRELGAIDYMNNNDYEAGLRNNEKSLELARKTGNNGLIIYCTTYVCLGLVCLNHIDQAKEMAEQLEETSKEHNHAFGMMAAKHFLGDCALISANFKEAEQQYSEGMKNAFNAGDIFVALQDMRGVAMSIGGQSRFAKAIRLNAAALEHAKKLDIILLEGEGMFWGNFLKKYIYAVKETIAKKDADRYEEEGKTMGIEAAIEYALDFNKD